MARNVEVSPAVQEGLAPWYDAVLFSRTTVITGSLLGRFFGLFGQGAVTINRTVHLAPNAPSLETNWGVSLLGHELYHVLQQETMGWWPFFFHYLWGWRPWHIKDGSRHPLEAPAYARQQEIYRALGT